MPFHELNLSHFHQVLTDELLLPILTGAQKHLVTLDLSNCSLFSNQSITSIASLCPHLEVLTLKNIDNPQDYRLGFVERRGFVS